MTDLPPDYSAPEMSGLVAPPGDPLRPVRHLPIIVGLSLFFGGCALFGIFGAQLSIMATLGTSAGISILLTEFGAHTVGSWKKWKMVGSSALTFVLFCLQMYYIITHFSKNGMVHLGHADFQKVAFLRIVDDHPLYEYRDLNTDSFQFVVMKDKFINQCINIDIDTKEKGQGKEWFQLNGNGSEIAKKYIRNDWSVAINWNKYIGGDWNRSTLWSDANILWDKFFKNDIDDLILWSLDYKNKIVTDKNREIVFQKTNHQNEDSIVSCMRPENSNLSFSFSLSTPAFAEPMHSIDKDEDNNQDVDVGTLIQNLTMDDPTLRHDARDALVAIGPTAITPILNALHRTPEDYRLKLGTVVIINSMLRSNPEISSEISSKLNGDDIRLFVNATFDKDDSIGDQATKLLYSLKDKRVISASLSAVENNNNEDGVYNNVLILKEIVPSLLSSYERKHVKDEVLRLVPAGYVRTRELADTIDP
jgi:hypothetical protein